MASPERRVGVDRSVETTDVGRRAPGVELSDGEHGRDLVQRGRGAADDFVGGHAASTVFKDLSGEGPEMKGEPL